MSIARHHAEWQSLVEVSGPFLSMAVLEKVFPQGIDDVDSELREKLRLAHEEWLDAVSGRLDVAIHNAWIRVVFRDALGFDERDILQDSPQLRLPVPEHRDTLAATFAIKNPDGRDDAGRPRLLVSVLDPKQDPDRALPDTLLKAAPVDRMLLLLRGLQAQGAAFKLGLVTNGSEWVLLHVAPNETTTYVRWTSELWFDEPLTLRAFTTLVSARRLFGVPDDESLEALIAQSSKDAQEVTDRLGAQVRRATEVLVQTIDRLDRDRGGQLLEGISPVTLYESAVTVMMRLVFLLAAEERKLLLLGVPVYDQHYALSTLHDQLQTLADRHGEEVLERRYDAWSRLLGTFRAVFAGIEHTDLRLPAYGGSLFNPDRFPFLEGRLPKTKWDEPAQKAVAPLAIDNRTVLHLLRAITRLEMKAGAGHTETRRLSFRALDVEQIGHVYEGLLDHTARRAEDVVLSLAGKNEPEIDVSELESRKKDTDGLVSWLAEETGRGAPAVKKALEYKIPKDDDRELLMACENVTPLYERVRPWTGLIRKDTHGMPVVIPKGSVYVTEGADRRSTGTHYTPRILTEPIVQYTLEPLVYEGPAEGKPREEWRLRSAKEILDLRVCDLAMGSGAFLVQTCRYLSERLVEAWEAEEKRVGTRLILAPDGRLSTGDTREKAVPLDEEERLVMARRFVADRCLYGVDKNPWAVEMGKLSLWLTTMQRGRPFTFLDHALRTGDSLLGVTHEDQLLYFHLDPARGKKLHDNMLGLHGQMKKALAQAREIRERLEDFATDDIKDSWQKEFLLKQAQDVTAELRVVGDLIIGAALATATRGEKAYDELLRELSIPTAKMLTERDPGERKARRAELRKRGRELLNSGREVRHAKRSTFHWAIEFPEVMGRGGFDGFVGNPPFRGGKMITGGVGTDYRDHLVNRLAEGRKGHADLCAYFFLRASSLLCASGGLGMLSTNTIAQGDTREVGLDALLSKGYLITRAIPSRAWPGDANLEVAHLWLRRGQWRGQSYLDESAVSGIGAHLTVPSRVSGSPMALAANAGKSFVGSYILGMGFTVSPEEALEIIKTDRRYREVLFPYLNGQDLNSDPLQAASRWVINFFDWPLDHKLAPPDYQGPVAADYPRCLDIVRRTVKPERQRKRPDGSYVLRKPLPDRWWHYADKRPGLYAAIARMKRVLVKSEVGNKLSFAFVSTKAVLSHMLVVFAFDQAWQFAVLQSTVHEAWARQYGSSMRNDLRYTPTDCFETFPFFAEGHATISTLTEVGTRYEECRTEIMQSRREGLTKTYNRFHSADERDPGIWKLRELHAEMDEAVKLAYGWDDLKLDHGFHETKQGIRYTISEAARVEVLDRLLELNHQRYAEEVKAGLHGDEKKPKKAAPKKTAAPKPAKKAGGKSQMSLLGEEE